MPTIRSSAGSSSRNRPQGNLLYDEPTGGFKKRRLGRACDMCRQSDVGNSKCIQTEAGSSYSAIALQCLVEEILSSSIPYPVPEEKDAIRKMVVDLATYARKLETRIHSLAQSLAKFYPELECKCPCDEPVDDGVEWLSDFLGNVSVSDHEGPFLGKSSTLSLVKLAWNTNNTYRPEEVDHSNDGGLCHQAELIDAMAESLTMRGPYSSAEHRQLEFPPYEMILNLTDVYFNHISIIVPFLHGPTFKRRLLQGFHLRDKEFGGLVLSVCACAALINPPNPKTSSQVSTETIMAWYDQFDPTSMNFLRPMSLYQLQTILVRPIPLSRLLLDDVPTSSCSQNCIILIPFWLPNWTILFNTIRHVQGIGIHRKQWYDQQKISSTEKELWKRAFWILVAYDIYMADYFGRTATLVPEDYDLDVPIDCDDDYWPGERPGDTGRDFQQPEGKPSTIAHWLSSLHLLTIYRYSQRTIYAIRRPQFIVGDDPTWRSKVVSQLDSAMNKWVNKMPAHLRWDPKATDVHVLALGDRDSAERHRIIEVQKTALHLTFYCMQIQIHYPLMDKTPGTSHGGSHVHLIICVNAARSCVHLLDMYSQKYKIPPVSHIFVGFLELLAERVVFMTY
ncbi:hypothetical protein D9758_012892 [Tetrapyrgos nigripes]|uniref:Xylanolytic transcriptional activator regulatory domain-containing protein n=1 Tax=Tetrapyrgos nigripes TaxID=182062 RepID=A0A8H5FNS5_9AGAR|nr:hypothetical protein D9758_012892 [Tetrapyrgos nigripes]